MLVCMDSEMRRALVFYPVKAKLVIAPVARQYPMMPKALKAFLA